MTRKGYNERLFSGFGLRQKYHLWRFNWLNQQTKKFLPPEDIRLVELGCFDARSIDYLPAPPSKYVGLDADWEGGLTAAQQKFSSHAELTFVKSTSPDDLLQFPDGVFNAGVSMETLEHIPPELVERYLEELARAVNGYVFITVPNEKGLVFLLKHFAKQLLGATSSERYNVYELINATLGRMSRVEREQHKGFDHDALREQIARHFEIVSVSGGPVDMLPARFNLTVAIVARSRK